MILSDMISDAVNGIGLIGIYQPKLDSMIPGCCGDPPRLELPAIAPPGALIVSLQVHAEAATEATDVPLLQHELEAW